MIAFLSYLDGFYVGAVALPEKPNEWYSGPEDFGHYWENDGIVKIVARHSGKPLELHHSFWVMRNVRGALQTLAVQSHERIQEGSCAAGTAPTVANQNGLYGIRVANLRFGSRVKLASLALAADEDAVDPSAGRFAPIALEHLKERAERLQQEWCEDHARLFRTA